MVVAAITLFSALSQQLAAVAVAGVLLGLTQHQGQLAALAEALAIITPEQQ
jgi:hypothetical protein